MQSQHLESRMLGLLPAYQNMTTNLTHHLPKHLWLLLALYAIASFTHFVHNAEYLAFYPNMPRWVGRDTVYLVWLAITSVGVIALLFHCVGWRVLGLITLMLYGATGFDGLGHYALALCAEHTWAQNFTIWFEVVCGGLLVVSAAWALRRSGTFAAS